MKKFSAIMLAAVLLITSALCSLPVAAEAPEGIPIGPENLSALASIDPTLSYYLTGDITLPAMTISGTFSGTIDGCGHTVTVSVPIFENLSGTVKNLNIVGAVSDSSNNPIGAVARKVSGGTARLENISNAANVTGGAAAVGGLIGQIDGYGTVFENIENSGTVKGDQITGGVFGRYNTSGGSDPVIVKNVHNTGDVTGVHRTGGVGGYINNALTASEVSNSGAITSDNTKGNPQYAGGIFGFVGGGVASSMTSAVNTGAITGKAGASAAGIVGLVECKLAVDSCANFGEISDSLQTTTSSFLGGIAGRVASTAGSSFENCANFGAIVGEKDRSLVGGIAGTIEKAATIKNCMNLADLSGRQVGGAVGQAAGDSISISLFINNGDITYSFAAPFIGYAGTNISHKIAQCINIGNFTKQSGVARDVYVYSLQVPEDNTFIGVPNTVTAVFCQNVSKYCHDGPDFPVAQNVFDVSVLSVSDIVSQVNTAFGTTLVAEDNGNIVLVNWCEAHADFDDDLKCDICGKYISVFEEISITLGQDITVNYYVNAAGLTDPQIEFTINTYTKTVDGELDGDQYKFAFDGVAPQWIGDTITATLISGGSEVEVKEYSVLKYLNVLKSKYPSNTELVTLVDGLLLYGAAAQAYTGHTGPALADGITGSANVPTSTDKDVSKANGTVVKFSSANVYFNNVNKLRFKFTAESTENLTFTVKIGDGAETAISYFADGEGYVLLTDPIYATGFDDVYTITAYVNGVQDSSVTYSVNSYVYSMMGSADEKLGALVKATYNYGVAADAYSNAG